MAFKRMIKFRLRHLEVATCVHVILQTMSKLSRRSFDEDNLVKNADSRLSLIEGTPAQALFKGTQETRQVDATQDPQVLLIMLTRCPLAVTSI